MLLSTKKYVKDLTMEDLSKICSYVLCNDDCLMSLICCDITRPKDSEFTNTLNRELTEEEQDALTD